MSDLHERCRDAVFTVEMDRHDRNVAFTLIERDIDTYRRGDSVRYSYDLPDERGKVYFPSVQELLTDIKAHIERARRGEFSAHLRT